MGILCINKTTPFTGYSFIILERKTGKSLNTKAGGKSIKQYSVQNMKYTGHHFFHIGRTLIATNPKEKNGSGSKI